jgi:hypothetical protein
MGLRVKRYECLIMAENLFDLICLNRKFYADKCSFIIKLELLGEKIVG